MAIRAGVVVTGTEVLTGRVADRNGPWLAEQLRANGADIAQIVVVGDRPDDLRAALRYLAGTGADLVITSGGLGPTADDLTAEVVADVQGRAMRLDTALEQRIAAVVARLSAGRGWRMDPASTAAAVRKQAHVAEGSTVLEPVGTAPGLVVPAAAGGPPVVVLPGPPSELQRMWPAALDAPEVRAVLARADELRQRTIRLWGPPESELAAALRGLDGEITGLEVTTCLREGELEIVTRYAPDAQPQQDRLRDGLAAAFGAQAYSLDGRTVDELVVDALRDQRRTVATAESCTGGLLAARLTERAGSSAYVLAGVVAYADRAKQDWLGVPAELIDAHGAVSAEVAAAMADGVRERTGADLGVGITGIAGPGGGSAAKPVGTVHLCVSDGAARHTRHLYTPGDRAGVRRRSVVTALHLMRELLVARAG